MLSKYLSRLLRPVAAALLIAALFSACNKGGETDSLLKEARNEIADRQKPDSVLFIILDAFDAGHVTHLGYERDTTPNLDRLAKSGISFTQAHSQSANTNSSTSSFLTGQYPPAAAEIGSAYSIRDEDYPLAEAFLDKGFKTAAFSENPYVDPNLGYAKGFTHFGVANPMLPIDDEYDYRRRHATTTTDLINHAETWIAANSDSPWFCYMHLLRPHDPYEAPSPFAEKYTDYSRIPNSLERETEIVAAFTSGSRKTTPEELDFLIDRYDANIAYIDHLVGQLIERLTVSGKLDSTLIVIASDHGEAFMQHGRIGHNYSVYEEMIHVPLIILTPPSLSFRNGRIDTPVEMLDLYPTFVDIFDLTAKNQLHGQSLLPLLLRATTSHKPAHFSQTKRAEYISLRGENQKVIFSQNDSGYFEAAELYDLAADPLEKENLLRFDSDISEARILMEHYRTEYYLRPIGLAPNMTPEQIEALESLGYVESLQAEPNP